MKFKLEISWNSNIKFSLSYPKLLRIYVAELYFIDISRFNYIYVNNILTYTLRTVYYQNLNRRFVGLIYSLDLRIKRKNFFRYDEYICSANQKFNVYIFGNFFSLHTYEKKKNVIPMKKTGEYYVKLL